MPKPRIIKTPKRRTIDCTSLDMGELLTQATAADMSEVVLRVSQRSGPKMLPVKWQATVRYRNATLPWSVCVADDPTVAIKTALYNAYNKDLQNDDGPGTLRQSPKSAGVVGSGRTVPEATKPLRRIKRRKGNVSAKASS